MASTNTTPKDEYVDLFVPRGYANEDPNLFISVNGKNYLLPRGKTSKVPKCVKDEYELSLKAQERLYEKSEELIEKTKAPIAEY